MIRNFLSTPNIIGRLFIVLLFAGGVVFAGAFDGFVVETEASSCCGGGMDDAIFSSSSCCDDDDPEDDACGCCVACSDGDACPDGAASGCGGNGTQNGYCFTDCPCKIGECTSCDLTVCDNQTAQQCYSKCGG